MKAQKTNAFDVYVGNLYVFEGEDDVLGQPFAAAPNGLSVFVENIGRWMEDLIRGG